MRTKIRLKRLGKRGTPFFRIVVSPAQVARDGQEIEKLGYFNPVSKECMINRVRLQEWLLQGAELNPSVERLLKRETLDSKS